MTRAISIRVCNQTHRASVLFERSFFHLLVNFNRIWILHISVFWYYTAFNAPKIYEPFDREASTAQLLSASALGGAMSTFLMICATLAEFSYIPTTWNNTSHLARRMAFLLVCLVVTIAPAVYIHGIVGPNDKNGRIPTIVSYVHIGVSGCITALFSLVPSGRSTLR